MTNWDIECLLSDGQKIHIKAVGDGNNGILQEVEMPNPLTVKQKSQILTIIDRMMNDMELLKIIKMDCKIY